MSVYFPLVNIRKNPDGSWNQNYTSEEITVPLTSPYVVRLIEVPDNGTVHSKPVISGLTEVSSYPPTNLKFWINYYTGDIVFNSSQAGNTYIVDYWQKGSLIEADEINWLYDYTTKQKILKVYNDSESILPSYKFVKATGSITINEEDLPIIGVLDSLDYYNLGLIISNIPSSSSGYILQNGIIRIIGLNTASYNIGDYVYCTNNGDLDLSPGTNRPIIGIILSKESDGLIYINTSSISKGLWQTCSTGIYYTPDNVGIGTNNATRKLEILDATNAQLRLSYSSSIYTEIQTDSSGYLKFSPTGLKIGINKTPTEALDVLGNIKLSGNEIVSTGSIVVGGTTVTRKIDSIDATNAQLRLSYTAGSIYSEIQTDSNGYINLLCYNETTNYVNIGPRSSLNKYLNFRNKYGTYNVDVGLLANSATLDFYKPTSTNYRLGGFRFYPCGSLDNLTVLGEGLEQFVPIWSGVQYFAELISLNGYSYYPILSIYSKYSTLTNPTESNFYIKIGMSYDTINDPAPSIPSNLIIETSNSGTVILVADYVGINELDPDTNLDINGQIKIRGGNPGINKVLISDANGLASWTDTVSVSGGEATSVNGYSVSGNANYIVKFNSANNLLENSNLYELSSNIGLNTITPRARLDILDDTGAQLRLTYTDDTIYSDFKVYSTGSLSLVATKFAFGPIFNDPYYPFQFSMTGNPAVFQFVNSSTTNNDILLLLNSANDSYNTIVESGDQAIIFSNGSADTGNLVIAPWASSTYGIRITYDGKIGINTSSPTDTLTIYDQRNSSLKIYEFYNSDGVNIRTYSARGTIASPTQILSGSSILGLSAWGYDSSSSYGNVSAYMRYYAAEDFASGAHGSYITFGTTPTGSNTVAERIRISSSGFVGINDTSPTGQVDIKGYFRVKGNYGINVSPTSGRSVEIFYNYGATTDKGLIFAYDRDTPGYKELRIDGSYVLFATQNTSAYVGIHTSTPRTRLDILDTSDAQIRLTYTDNSVYTDLKTDSNGYMIITPTGLRLGIGTSNPRVALDILDTAGAQVRLTYTDNSVYTSFQTNSSGYLIVVPTGSRFGLGITTPQSYFHISTVYDTYTIRLGGVLSSGHYTGICFGSDTASTIYSAIQFSSDAANDASLRFRVWDGTAGGTERLVIKGSGGYIGVNTSTPRTRLDILDASSVQLRLTYTDNSVYTGFQTTSSGYLYITPTGNRVSITGRLQITGITTDQFDLLLSNTYTDLPATKYVIYSGSVARYTANNSNGLYAMTFAASATVNTGISFTGSIRAMFISAYRNSDLVGSDDSGSASDITGCLLNFGHNGVNTSATPSTTYSYGIFLRPYYVTGTITTMYGLYIGSEVTGGTVTNKWGIYQASANFSNYFGGYTGFNTSTPRVRVDIKDTSAAQIRLTYTDNSVYANLQADSSGNLILTPTGTKVSTTKYVECNYLDIVDGISEPASESGHAKIYVDTADGDLKIIYGDGTVKTIVVDS